MPTIGWFEILIVVAIAIVVLGPKDFPVMLKKVGSRIGTATRHVNNIKNEGSNIEIDDETNNNKKKKDSKENAQGRKRSKPCKPFNRSKKQTYT